ncbi:L-serine ammonia-lyase [Solimonas sp. K1W22B-7]|uniref:L-serine ammonia-lyase n=1 Tax=Solimonas sp. K1W22B-7 TaxID=2303331 RepID=UPI000E333EB3|nr:L-serine ammonia-lyase [Solimonas sp. K1W22B-7]AXQ28589.1 L-serine ammonia-lyase [Solimonas sp. K1W22B-7]
MQTSILDLFKIGIGPSSSHTVGPMRAARAFAEELAGRSVLGQVACLQVEIFGSLAATGIGHGTDWAIKLGLAGHDPRQVYPAEVPKLLEDIRTRQSLSLLGSHAVIFVDEKHLLWRPAETLARHSNGLRFTAFDAAGQPLHMQVYFSVGGGFIERGDEVGSDDPDRAMPHPYADAAQMLERAASAGLALWQLVEQNECTLHGREELDRRLAEIWAAMSACIDRGLQAEGTLPGGLGVRRRAGRLHARLSTPGAGIDPMSSMDWLNAYAMAVNEENACGGRVVTAPTNGASGVLPAVLRYYERFMPGASPETIRRFLLVAGAIGVLYLENASISGAEVGCQGEVGVACSMAAAGLAAALGASNDEIEHAAEIGMEHHLGMTCDPVRGLVQIPCIERNAIGAVKAVNACRMAMQERGSHRVSLDEVMRTMLETGRDMQARYKETSLAGLAVHAVRRWG